MATLMLSLALHRHSRLHPSRVSAGWSVHVLACSARDGMSSVKRRGRPAGTGTGKARELEPVELERLTAAATNPRDRALVWLCVGAGLRVGEACTMNIGHVGTDGSVLVEGSRAKSRRSRRCYIAPRAAEYLGAYLATRPNAGHSEPLFPSQKGGGHMTANSGVHLVVRLMSAAGIQGASSHSLRRTHANTARRQGVDILIVQRQLGHARINTTAEYLSASEAERRAAINGIEL